MLQTFLFDLSLYKGMFRNGSIFFLTKLKEIFLIKQRVLLSEIFV